MKIQSTGGYGQPTNPYRKEHNVLQDPDWRQFDHGYPRLPVLSASGEVVPDGEWDVGKVWQAWEGKVSLRDCTWVDCRHPHEDYERNGIETRCIYRVISPSEEKREVKHTPGPWKIIENLPNWVRTSWGEDICRCSKQSDRNEWIANTHLIAASPDLLSALEAATLELEGLIPGIDVDVLEKCYAAITKAKEGRG